MEPIREPYEFRSLHYTVSTKMKAAKLAYPMDEFYPSLTLPAPVAGPLQAGEPPAYISLHMSTHKLYS